jgi:hypothetical protein
VRRRRRFEQSRSPTRREFASNGEHKSSRTPDATFCTLLCRDLASPSDTSDRAGRPPTPPAHPRLCVHRSYAAAPSSSASKSSVYGWPVAAATGW